MTRRRFDSIAQAETLGFERPKRGNGQSHSQLAPGGELYVIREGHITRVKAISECGQCVHMSGNITVDLYIASKLNCLIPATLGAYVQMIDCCQLNAEMYAGRKALAAYAATGINPIMPRLTT